MSNEKDNEQISTMRDALMSISSQVPDGLEEGFNAELEGIIASTEARFARIRKVDPNAKFDLVHEAKRELESWKREKEKVVAYDEYLKYFEANRSNDDLKPVSMESFFGPVHLSNITIEKNFRVCQKSGIVKGATAMRHGGKRVVILGVTPQCLLVISYDNSDSEGKKKGTVGLNPSQFTVIS